MPLRRGYSTNRRVDRKHFARDAGRTKDINVPTAKKLMRGGQRLI